MAVTLRFTISSLKLVNLRSNDVCRLLGVTVSLPRVLPAVNYDQSRCYSFFRQSEDSDQMYGSLTGLSNTGLKRGRGRGSRKKVDLNRGQHLGVGKSGMVWPGLNQLALKDKQVLRIHKQTPNQEYFDNIIKIRSKKDTVFRNLRIPALLRGWTGRRMAGMSCGAPDPIGDYKFEGFDSRVLQLKQVCHMTGTKKNKYRYSCLVVTGNGNGLGGIALSKASNSKTAIKKAKNRAAQQLQYIRRYDDHTLYHNFYSQQTATKIFCYRKHEGYGLVCHRCLKTICEVIGIHNMYAKVEGSTGNIQNLTKGFFYGLRQQETHQELADRMKLHVVELRKEYDNVPIVIASPSDGNVRTEPLKKEDSNLEFMYFDNRLPLPPRKKRPFYSRDPGHNKAQKEKRVFRNQKSARIQRIVYDIEPERPKSKMQDEN